MKIQFSIFCFLMLLISCAKDREEAGSIVYGDNIVLILGKKEVIKPKSSLSSGGASFSCTMGDKPTWISIDKSTCNVHVTSIKTGNFGPYNIKATSEGSTVDLALKFKVNAPDELILPVPSTSPAISKYYQSITLTSNSNYVVTFSATGLTFMNATNPYEPDVIKVIATGGLGAGAPQALASTPNYIHVATTTGHIMTFDWSDRSDPVFAHKALVAADGGQNYDLASDNVSKLFVANTDRNRFSVVDVSDPLNPVTEYTNNTLGSYAAGVTYSNNHAYVTAYGGKIFTFGKDANGDWQVTSELNTNIANPSRPFSSNKYLIASRYSGNQFEVFSLENPATPEHIATVDAQNKIQIYSRILMHDGQIYVSTIGAASAKILVYDIGADGSSFTLASAFEPKDENGDYYSQVSLALFRNDSFLIFIGTDASNGNNRELNTAPFPLELPTALDR